MRRTRLRCDGVEAPRTLCATTFEFSSVASETKALGEMVFTPYAMSSVSFCGAR